MTMHTVTIEFRGTTQTMKLRAKSAADARFRARKITRRKSGDYLSRIVVR